MGLVLRHFWVQGNRERKQQFYYDIINHSEICERKEMSKEGPSLPLLLKNVPANAQLPRIEYVTPPPLPMRFAKRRFEISFYSLAEIVIVPGRSGSSYSPDEAWKT